MGFCYQKNFSNPTLPVDEAQFYALVRATKWKENIDKYRETGEASLKRQLPAFIFQAMFDETTSKAGKTGRWRKQAATRLTGLVVMDIDHIENPKDMFQKWDDVTSDPTGMTSPNPSCRRGMDTVSPPPTDGMDTVSPPPTDGMDTVSPPPTDGMDTVSPPPTGGDRGGLKELGILLIYITPSGHGLKIVFKADAKKGNLIDNQHAMAKVLGVEVDESCKDASRMSFICKEEDILYIDKELFTYENKEFSERYTALYRDGHSQGTHAVVTPSSSPCRGRTQGETQGDCPPPTGGDGGGLEQVEQIKWRGYEIQGIIDARYGDNLPCKDDSNRHTESLKLATDLLLMLDGDKRQVQRIVEAQSWVKEIIEERGENVGQTVQSAAECVAQKERKYASSLPSKAMLEAIQEATGKTYQEITRHSVESPCVAIDSLLWEWGAQIEELSEDFPLLKDICKGLKRNQYPAAMFVAGGLMMTLMTRCTYRFYHRPEELRRLNNSTFIIGDPASGKSFATRLFKLLAAPIVAADKIGKDAINAYREQMRTKGANKEKPKKPKVIVRVHPARTSNAQFIQDMVNSVEEVDGQLMQLHMLTFDTELDNTVTVQKGGSWIDKQSLELKAFHNEEDGQAYSNNDSILQDFYVTWNFIYTGTPIALKKKVNEQNFGSGLATRLTCIPLPATNFEMMDRESRVDFNSDERLKSWAEKLDRMKGELSVQKIVDDLYDWTARRMMDAKENESRADEMLLKRCAYHGLNFAAPFIVIRHWGDLKQDGTFWCGEFETDDTDWKLVELIVNIQYACQRHYFGAMAEAYFDNRLRDASVNVRRKQKTYDGFERLPESFTSEDVMRCFNMGSDGSARMKISRFLQDHLIEKIEEPKGKAPSKAKYRKTGMIMY